MSTLSALIDRLQAQYPALNVAEIARGCEAADRPEAALLARCRKAGKAAFSFTNTAKPKEPPFTGPDDPRNKTWHGRFYPDGSWRETGIPQDYLDAPVNSVTWFVRKAVLRRRLSANWSPRDCAIQVEARRLGEAFPWREVWLDAPHADCSIDDWWHSVPTATSAEAAVKYRGYGGYFDVWTRDDGRIVDPIEASRLVAESVARLAGKGDRA